MALVSEIIGALRLFAVVLISGTAAYFVGRLGWWALSWVRGGDHRARARSARRAYQIRRGWKELARRVDLAPVDKAKTGPADGPTSAMGQKGPVPRLYPPIRTRVDQYSVTVRLKTVPGVTATSIKAKAEDLGNAWKVNRVKVTTPKPGQVVVRAYLREPLEAHLPSTLVQSTPEGWRLSVKPQSLTPLTSIRWGVNEDGDDVTSTLGGGVHGLIAGVTRSGKSICANTLLATASLTRHVRLVLIDPNLGAAAPWWRTAYRVSDSTDPGDAADILDEITDELEQRKALFWQLRTDRITKFTDDCPLYVVVIDEAANFTRHPDKKKNERFTASLLKFASQSAKYGGRLWLLTQKPASDVINTTIRMNLTSRICFRVDTVEDFVMAFPEGRSLAVTAADRAMPQGVAVVSLAAEEPARFRAVYLPTEACWAIGDALVDAGLGVRELPGDAAKIRHLSIVREDQGEEDKAA